VLEGADRQELQREQIVERDHHGARRDRCGDLGLAGQPVTVEHLGEEDGLAREGDGGEHQVR
jgi:hypothetical protein